MKLLKGFNRRLPKNFILKNPFMGTIILLAFQFFFIILYRPLNLHGSRSLSIELTMALYIVIMFLPVYTCSVVLNRIPYFSKEDEWTLLKELTGIVVMLLCIGTTVYLAGFLLEDPTNRWNLKTFWSSVKITSMIGIIPLLFFSIANYRFLFYPNIFETFNQSDVYSSSTEKEEIVQINSQLKKEELSFFPEQFIFAESDGNYVIFHLLIDGHYVRKTIRNSINEIEQQLSGIPFIFRIHRAFLVNLKKVVSKKGNSLGYRLRLSGTDLEISVSRNNTRTFDQLMEHYK